MKLNKPKSGDVISSGQSTGAVYALEARLKFKSNPPIVAGGMTIDGEWRHVRTVKANWGIPNHIYDEQAKGHGYLERDAATALAYWLIADANKAAIEVRLVEHEFMSTHKVTMLRNLPPIKTYDYAKEMIKRAKRVESK